MTRLRALARRLAEPAIGAVATRAAAVGRDAGPADVTTELLLGPAARLNDRRMTRPDVDRLTSEVAQVTGTADALGQVAQALRTLVDLEGGSVGRVAGTTANIVGKLATAPLLLPERDHVDVLEIGTLYGIFAAGVHRQLLRRGAAHHITVVDPLESVQVQPERARAADPSGTPVTEATVRANWRLAAVDLDALTLERGLSTDPVLRGRVAGPFDLVIIDGDHSKAGVAQDLVWAETLVRAGTVVVMDDYGDPGWPGVQDALDEHLAAGSALDLRGVVATSAFLVAR